MFKSTLCLSLLFTTLLALGCRDEKPEDQEPPAPKDNPDAVANLEAYGAKLKRNEATGNVVEVDYRGSDPDGADLVPLRGLVEVTRVYLTDCVKIKSGDIAAIAAAPTIEVLDLRNCEVDDDSLIDLLPLTKLRAFWLSDKEGQTNVTIDGMETLTQFENLQVLGLDHLWVTDEWLEQLTGLTKLRELYLGDTLVDDQAIQVIIQFPQLERLRISGTRVSDEGLALLPRLKNLKHLDISEITTISNFGMEPIGEMTQLERLNLWRAPIDDKDDELVEGNDNGISYLAGLVNLKWLNLDNTDLSDEGMRYLANMTQLEFLHLGSTAVTDEGLEYLEGMTNLKQLMASRTGITTEGAAELQEKLPEAEIDLEYHPGG